MKVYVKSYGCSANFNDGEIMEGLLQNSGRQIVSTLDEADTIILNTCTVKGKTESSIKNEIRKIRENFPGKKLVVGGCMPQAQPEMLKEFAQGVSLIGPHQISEIVEVVNSDETLYKIEKKAEVKVGLPKIRRNPVINIVQINEGCLGSCSFCITKLAKPKLMSYPMAQIREEIEKGVLEGCKEVWLTSQDTAAYGKEFRRSLPMLMGELDGIKGDFWVRIGMMNPDNILGMENEMVEVLKNDKVFKFLHIPIQAGCDKVLKEMKRAYTIDEFKSIVEKFRKEIPDISISTDIICGFPGETDQEFEETLQLCRDIKFDTINVSRYWERPGTASSKMAGKLNGNLTKERSTKLKLVWEEIAEQKNKSWIGWKGKIIVDEKGKVLGTWAGRNQFYKPVIIHSDENLVGKWIDVEITGATRFDLRGNIDGSF